MSGPGGRPGIDRVELAYGVATDVGRVRETNEDSYLAVPPVFVVADGMGGHDGGDVASRIVVEEFASLADSGYDPRDGADAVLSTLDGCQRRLAEYAATHRGSGGRPWRGGTTAVVAVLADDPHEGPGWLLTNLGDSRIYRYARGELHRVSTDHSVVQQLVDSGRITEEEARVHPERHIVTRALGAPEALDPDFFRVSLTDGERVLLCSDGITDLVRDPEIAEVLSGHPEPGEAADALVAAALDAGGVDNATALVVDVVGWSDEPAGGARHQPGRRPDDLGVLP
jgi:protein phosphatase